MHLMNQQSCLFLYRLFTYLERIPLRNLWCRKDRQERPQQMPCMSIPVQRSCWFGSSGHLLCHHGCLRWDCWLAKCGSLRPSSFDFKASRDDLVAFFNTVVHEGELSVYIEWPYLHSLLFPSKSHEYIRTLRRETSPNLSKSIFQPN